MFAELGVDPDESLYLYQFLNTVPELTDPEMFNILKFDQYKYQTAGVPFRSKWDLASCITRDPIRESMLKDSLKLDGAYAVAHLTGSSARVEASIITWLDPAVRIVNIDDHLTDNLFDWISVLEGASAIVCLDSAVANLVDQLCITGPELYWIRRSAWDLTPVLGSAWTIVPTNLPIQEPKRVDPAAMTKEKLARAQPANNGQNGLTSHVPFETDKSKVPTSFMHALRK